MEQVSLYAKAKMEKVNGIGSNSNISDRARRNDEWKEKFLISLKEEHVLEALWRGSEYTVWGMPFFNEDIQKSEFHAEFIKLLN